MKTDKDRESSAKKLSEAFYVTFPLRTRWMVGYHIIVPLVLFTGTASSLP